MVQSPAFTTCEWVAEPALDGTIGRVFQLRGPSLGAPFTLLHRDFYFLGGEDIDITGLTLCRIRTITPSEDLRSTIINPPMAYGGKIYVTGWVQDLVFDPQEWMWRQVLPVKAASFFNYSTKHGYRITLANKPQTSGLHVKQQSLGLTEDKSILSIKRT